MSFRARREGIFPAVKTHDEFRCRLALALLQFVSELLAESDMLRSSNVLKDFSIAATDGDVGQVETFCFDDKEWTVRYILVNTGGWLHARKVLISPLSISTIDWIGRGIVTDLTRAEVRASPRIDMQKAVLRQHEAAYRL